jgi:deoxyribonuclease-4
MLDELDRADLLGISYVVVHPGAHVGAGEALGIQRVARSLDWIARQRPDARATICLEGTAGQGSNLGRTFEQLAAMIEACAEPERLGICLDSCHLFAAGYDLRSAAAWRATLRAFDEIVGLARLRCLHLNDSKGGLGSRLDRHAHIGQGKLGRATFRHIVNTPELNDLPATLETPIDADYGYADNLATIRKLVRRPRRPRRVHRG